MKTVSVEIVEKKALTEKVEERLETMNIDKSFERFA